LPPIDMVVIHEIGGQRRVSPDQFLRLPLDLRVKLILERKIRFMNGDEAVDQQTGLRELLEAARRAA
jgi:hypothetical protein